MNFCFPQLTANNYGSLKLQMSVKEKYVPVNVSKQFDPTKNQNRKTQWVQSEVVVVAVVNNSKGLWVNATGLNSTILNTSSGTVTISGTGFDASNATENQVQMYSTNQYPVAGKVVQTTRTELVISFDKLCGYVRTYVCMFLCMYICMYVCSCASNLQSM